MPRFHFNVHDGTDMPDDEGTDLPDVQAAKFMAVRVAGDLLRDQAKQFWTGEEWSMDVTDDSGLTIFTLSFHASDTTDPAR